MGSSTSTRQQLRSTCTSTLYKTDWFWCRVSRVKPYVRENSDRIHSKVPVLPDSLIGVWDPLRWPTGPGRTMAMAHIHVHCTRDWTDCTRHHIVHTHNSCAPRTFYTHTFGCAGRLLQALPNKNNLSRTATTQDLSAGSGPPGGRILGRHNVLKIRP